jgi:hypothetical protein
MDNNILQLHIIKTIFEYFDNMIDLLSFAFTNKFIFDNVSKSQILKLSSEKNINALKYIVNFIQKSNASCRAYPTTNSHFTSIIFPKKIYIKYCLKFDNNKIVGIKMYIFLNDDKTTYKIIPSYYKHNETEGFKCYGAIDVIKSSYNICMNFSLDELRKKLNRKC